MYVIAGQIDYFDEINYFDKLFYMPVGFILQYWCYHLDEFYPGDTGGSLYDGRKQVLYWADVSCELACVVPSPDTYQPPGRRSSLDSSAGNNLKALQIFFPRIMPFYILVPRKLW